MHGDESGLETDLLLFPCRQNLRLRFKRLLLDLPAEILEASRCHHDGVEVAGVVLVVQRFLSVDRQRDRPTLCCCTRSCAWAWAICSCCCVTWASSCRLWSSGWLMAFSVSTIAWLLCTLNDERSVTANRRSPLPTG